jgi:hypothetical protein
VQDGALRTIWRDWKNVILVTAGVIVAITSLYWLPPVVSQFQSDPARVASTSKSISDTIWFVIFVLAAQSIFSNRKKRADLKKRLQAEAEAQKSDREDDSTNLTPR